MPYNEDLQKEVLTRLRTIKGHIGGIEKMVEEQKGCPDILMQVAAIRSSIEKLGVFLLENYAEECLLKAIRDKKDISQTFTDVVQQILRFLK